MKGYLLPLALALLLAAPAVWRLGGPAMEGGESEQAAQDGQVIDKKFTVVSYDVDGKLDTATEMPRVPETSELLKISFPNPGN